MSAEITRESAKTPNGQVFDVDVVRSPHSPAPIIVCDGPGIKCPYRGVHHSSIPTCKVEFKSHKGLLVCGKVAEPD